MSDRRRSGASSDIRMPGSSRPKQNRAVFGLILCLLVPLIFNAAVSGMEISGKVRMCCRSSPKLKSGARRAEILLYLSAAGSLISAYFIFR